MQNGFVNVGSISIATFLVFDEIGAELQQNIPILFINLELFTEQQFPLGIKINQDFMECVKRTFTIKFSKRLVPISPWD
ncbi:hypothetical protein MNBD_BACTEROID03-1515 [hydrothermal vent metagenome]|uniref:Uncharacterized protein n=1 Tax=hydrothermal vent metagenome TaxID=652676 RepID=A0A3B0UH64_9ZZZZ